MPYKGKRMSMIFLLPAIGLHATYSSLGDLEEAMLKVNDLNSILKFEQKSIVEVTLPRFKLESQLDLVEPLKQLGMTDMFDEAKADFSGMTGGTNNHLFVSQVVQKAFVEVNEEGTEAAAATGVGRMVEACLERPRNPVDMKVDHPFLLVIKDGRSHNVALFIGQVTDPSLS